jgi:mannitol/fructose-specific phosphotransferase system IIA component (Ntr-type)
MKIHKLIERDNVLLDLPATDVRSALAAVSEFMAPLLGLEAEEMTAALMEREGLGSTSIGNGFAIPHAKIPELSRIAIAAARFEQPVPFGGDTGTNVGFAFVVLSPPDQPAAHLQVLSQIARVLKRSDLREGLMTAGSADELTDVICRAAESEGL